MNSIRIFFHYLLKLSLLSSLFLISLQAYSQSNIDIYQFETKKQEAQFHELSKQLRCPKCQNNNIEDSTAPLAQDLRKKVHDMIIEGKSSKEIIDYMVDHYGNFITYKPPVMLSTIILWVAPLLFLALGFIFLIYQGRRTHLTEDKTELSSDEKKRLNELLSNPLNIEANTRSNTTDQKDINHHSGASQ